MSQRLRWAIAGLVVAAALGLALSTGADSLRSDHATEVAQLVERCRSAEAAARTAPRGGWRARDEHRPRSAQRGCGDARPI